jgi:DNA-binding MarR family transcriptional regulator
MDRAADTLGDVLTFMRLLWEVDHRLRSASKQMARTAGVTGPQRLVLRMVGRFPKVSAGDLAELLHVHPSTLTGVLDRLERRGLLARVTDLKDRRRALFRLTQKGRTVNTMKTGTVEAAVRRVIDRMSNQKIAAAREVLAELALSLNFSTGSRARRKRRA